MRRQLTLQAAAVTAMVALAFVVPLALLVRDQAADSALAAAERHAENVARSMALRAPLPLDSQDLAGLAPAGGIPYEVSIVSSDLEVVGAPVPNDEDLSAALQGTAARMPVPGGGVVYLPVIGQDGSTSVVRVFVPESEMRAGVARSWLILAVLGLALVLIAVLIADWIGRTIVRPVSELSSSAAKLGSGDLGARVTPEGPAEIRGLGVEFNRLAEQIDRLLLTEREAAADLSHRLRTPLTALRLDAESLQESEGRERVLDDLASLERTVDFVIDQARRGARDALPSERVDLVDVSAGRVAYWRPLAEEQGRDVMAETSGDEAIVAMDRDDAEVMLDALIGNVFAHTPEGTPLGVAVVIRDDDVLIAVEDGGPGFPDESVLERGRSQSSSGLGLDIARRSAVAAGGDLRVGVSRRLGGALVAVRLPLTPG
ncbi:MAG: HAMP domain-containing sensor histidine kinase [Acidimicrobiia bacterium]|jgi:signal transduction histidine kinase